MEHRSLEVAGDAWLAEMGGKGSSRRLEVKLNGRTIGPLVIWLDDRPALAIGGVVHQEELREGVTVRWRVKGDGVTVGVYYEGRGRAAIRTAVGDIGEWETTGGFPMASRSRWSS
jgi:hypothetical protein